MPVDEAALIDRYFARGTGRRRDVPLGIGDDAAVVRAPAGSEWVVALDVLNAGVHFPESTDPASIGHKALAVNLSDIAAMGAAPAWTTMGLSLPEADADWLQGFSDGFLRLAGRFNVQLIGGDMTRGPLSIAVQLIGEVGPAGYLTRQGAGAGDLIYVSGSLGDAALGLQVACGEVDVPPEDARYFLGRLNRPAPRVALGRGLAAHASAAIDISDGLAADLARLCEASGLGAAVNVESLPLSAALARRLPGADHWGPVLTFGDDYELCFTVPAAKQGPVERLAAELGERITLIGRMTGNGLEWLHHGTAYVFDGQGYRHFE